MAKFPSPIVSRNLRAVVDRLHDLEDFGSNPGNLRARVYIPDAVGERPALVVVLHGCTQTAAGYDAGAGWSSLADELGFMLLLPEQRRANNPNLCFNWFTPGDIRRGKGEAFSIRQMIAALDREHGIDPDRVFITGLSAGGAMTSVMLATYPEVFAGGAIIAGLPYGTAQGVPQALERMTGRGIPNVDELGALISEDSAHRGSWPTISVWHGSLDATVSPANAEAILAQWRSVHGMVETASTTDFIEGFPHRVWRDAAERAVIEYYEITGMGHGTPINATGTDSCGASGAFILDVGISSTRRIAAFWGLTDQRQDADPGRAPRLVSASPAKPSIQPNLPLPHTVRAERVYDGKANQAPAKGVGRIIEDALRAAGLMR